MCPPVQPQRGHGDPGDGVLLGGRRGRRSAGRGAEAPKLRGPPHGATPSDSSTSAMPVVTTRQPTGRDVTMSKSDLAPRHLSWSCFLRATSQHHHPHGHPTDPTSGALAESPRSRSPCQGWQPTATFSKATATITPRRPTQTRPRKRSEAPTCPSVRTYDAFGGKSRRPRPLQSVPPFAGARARRPGQPAVPHHQGPGAGPRPR